MKIDEVDLNNLTVEGIRRLISEAYYEGYSQGYNEASAHKDPNYNPDFCFYGPSTPMSCVVPTVHSCEINPTFTRTC